MITWTANENIWYDSILIATNVISNTLEYVLETDRLAWKGVGREGGVMLWFFPKRYFDAEFSRKNYFCKQNARKKIFWYKIFIHKNSNFFLLQGKNNSPPPFQIKRSLRYSFSLLYFFYLGMDKMVFSVATVKLLLGFIGWNLYHYMWSSVNCRHNVRHIRTISFLLPPDWDGWPLNFTIAHFL